MNEYDYTWEKLYAAISGMVVSEQAPRDRLLNAWQSALTRLNENAFDDEHREQWKELHAMATRTPARGSRGFRTTR